MIKIIKAVAATDARIKLVFSDDSFGELDLQPLIDRNTVLTAALADPAFRARCYLELGALCWPNGLELSAASIHQQLSADGRLQSAAKAA